MSFKIEKYMEAVMEKRVALIGIIVENLDSTPQINDILHEYAKDIIARLGVPYRERDVCIISIVIDAPQDKISALSGRLGRIDGVSVKAMYTKEK